MSRPDPEKITAQLKGIRQDLRALEEDLRQLANAFIVEEEKQLSPKTKKNRKQSRTKTKSKPK